MTVQIKRFRKSEKDGLDELWVEVDSIGLQQIMELEKQPEPTNMNSSSSSHPSLLIQQEVFDLMFNTSVTLYKQIQAKRDVPEAVITPEEANFANAFLVYCIELQKTLKEQNTIGDESHES